MEQFDFDTSSHEALVSAVVAAAKDHLDSDISFLGRFDGEMLCAQRTAFSGHSCPLEEGKCIPLEDTYCHRLIQEQISNVVNDARNHPTVKDLAVTRDLTIGGYIGVPVVLADGEIYGTLCCITHSSNSLNDKDVKFLSVLADILSASILRQRGDAKEHKVKRERIKAILGSDHPTTVYQPIVDIVTGRIIGAEALSRFSAEPVRSPDQWFNEAWATGLGVELEMHAVELAIAKLHRIPSNVYLSVNLSPETLVSDLFKKFVCTNSVRRIVFEVTEHELVSDYRPLSEAIDLFRKRGARLAIDDVGAGYSGLNRILQLRPDILKLDLHLNQSIHKDPAKQAMVSAVIGFAQRTGASVVAEGIETREEMLALRQLGVPYGQGYYFAKPAPLPLPVNMPNALYLTTFNGMVTSH